MKHAHDTATIEDGVAVHVIYNVLKTTMACRSSVNGHQLFKEKCQLRGVLCIKG